MTHKQENAKPKLYFISFFGENILGLRVRVCLLHVWSFYYRLFHDFLQPTFMVIVRICHLATNKLTYLLTCSRTRDNDVVSCRRTLMAGLSF